MGLVSGKFGDVGASCICGMAVTCKECSVGLALWVAEHSMTEVQRIGSSFHECLCELGYPKNIVFEDFGTGSVSLHPIIRAHATAGADDMDLQSPHGSDDEACPLVEETRYRGQGSCDISVVMPGLNETIAYQLVFKNSFIHAVVPVDGPLPVPTLRRMRTA